MSKKKSKFENHFLQATPSEKAIYYLVVSKLRVNKMEYG